MAASVINVSKSTWNRLNNTGDKSVFCITKPDYQLINTETVDFKLKALTLIFLFFLLKDE